MNRLRLFLIGLFVFQLSLNVLAHSDSAHSDIELTFQNNRIIVDPDNQAVRLGAYKLFQAEFGEFGNPYGTDHPSFDGFGLTPNSLLWYRVEDTLKKWDVNSSSWLSSGFDEQISIEKNAQANIISATGGFGGQGLIGSVNSSGGLHTHVDFEISKAGGGTPDDGAYLLQLSLFDTVNDAALTPISPVSDTFYLAFQLNQGRTFGYQAFQHAIAIKGSHHDSNIVVLQGGNRIEALRKDTIDWERNRQRENTFLIIEYGYHSNRFVAHRVEYVNVWREGRSRYYENGRFDPESFSIVQFNDRQVAVAINASATFREGGDEEGGPVKKSVMLGNLTGNIKDGEITRLRGDLLRQTYRCDEGCDFESPVFEPVILAKDALNLRRAPRFEAEGASFSETVDTIMDNFTNHTLICEVPMQAQGNRCVYSPHAHGHH